MNAETEPFKFDYEKKIEQLTAERDAARSELCREQEKLKMSDEKQVRENIAYLLKERDAAQKGLELLAKHVGDKMPASCAIKKLSGVPFVEATADYVFVPRSVVEERDAALKACGAVLHSIRKDGLVVDHSDEVQLLLNVLGERRTEQDATRMLQHKLQLVNRAEVAEKACAEIEKFRSKAWVSDAEVGVFQDRVRNLLIQLTGCPEGIIDGKGSDSGWEEFTLAEIGQAIAFVIDERDVALKACAEMKQLLGEADAPRGENPYRKDSWSQRLEHALSTDCGKDYHHNDEWQVVVEALRFIEYQRLPLGNKRVCEALAHAEKLMKQ